MHTFCKTVFPILNTEEKKKKTTTYFQFLTVCGVSLYYYFNLHSPLSILLLNACPAGRMSHARLATPSWPRPSLYDHAPLVLCSRPQGRGGCAPIGCPAPAPRWLVGARARRDWPVQKAGGAVARPWRLWGAPSTVSAGLGSPWGAGGIVGARPDRFRSAPLRRLPLLPQNGRPRWPQQREELLRVRGAGPRCLRLRPPGAVGAGQGRREGTGTHLAFLREIPCCVSSRRLVFLRSLCFVASDCFAVAISSCLYSSASPFLFSGFLPLTAWSMRIAWWSCKSCFSSPTKMDTSKFLKFFKKTGWLPSNE